MSSWNLTHFLAVVWELHITCYHSLYCIHEFLKLYHRLNCLPEFFKLNAEFVMNELIIILDVPPVWVFIRNIILCSFETIDRYEYKAQLSGRSCCGNVWYIQLRSFVKKNVNCILNIFQCQLRQYVAKRCIFPLIHKTARHKSITTFLCLRCWPWSLKRLVCQMMHLHCHCPLFHPTGTNHPTSRR